MNIRIRKKVLNFKRPAGTSRGVLLTKPVWYVIVEADGKRGIGECNPLKGLSIDDIPEFDTLLRDFAAGFESLNAIDLSLLENFPAMKFGFEMATVNLKTGIQGLYFPSGFTRGEEVIPINGLIWMGSKAFMLEQLQEKLEAGFNCIKMKIGAIGFEEELGVLRSIRKRFSPGEIELRVDANGAFHPEEALSKLEKLSACAIHSIEQPVKAGQWEAMARICRNSPIPVALDEELIPVRDPAKRKEMLQFIRPDYIILKPSLTGGFSDSDQWIRMAEKSNTGWWITSALESDIGLNAIAQYTFLKNNPLPQGLGTGTLYTNNIPSPLYISRGCLHLDPAGSWDLKEILS